MTILYRCVISVEKKSCGKITLFRNWIPRNKRKTLKFWHLVVFVKFRDKWMLSISKFYLVFILFGFYFCLGFVALIGVRIQVHKCVSVDSNFGNYYILLYVISFVIVVVATVIFKQLNTNNLNIITFQKCCVACFTKFIFV